MKKTKTITIRTSSTKSLKDVEGISKWMGKNFNVEDRQYFGGMIDGDGCIRLRKKNQKFNELEIVLELRYDHAEPVYKLAELFDLSIFKKSHLIKKNTQPSVAVRIYGVKAKLFLMCIYPYLLEKKEKCKKLLLEIGCPEKHLPKKREFSLEYLAGYTDAEGCITFKLTHNKIKNTGNICSSYKHQYKLSSNDLEHLQYIKKNLIDLGFDHFQADYILDYKNVKEGRNRNPRKWKPTGNISLGGTHKLLSKFYKEIEPLLLIKNKKDNMKSTIRYTRIIEIIK